MSRTVMPTGRRTPEFRTLKERLWWSRETAPLTQARLAAQLGISVRTIQNYERGTESPKQNRLVLWANACDVDFDWLAGDFYTERGEDTGEFSPDLSPGDTSQYLSPRRLRRSRSVAVQSPLVAQVA